MDIKDDKIDEYYSYTSYTGKDAIVSSNYKPNIDCLDFAKNNKIDEKKERERFIIYYRSKNTLSKNWDAIYLSWLKRSVAYAPRYPYPIKKTDNQCSLLPSIAVYKPIAAPQQDSELLNRALNLLKKIKGYHQLDNQEIACLINNTPKLPDNPHIHPEYRHLSLNKYGHPTWPQQSLIEQSLTYDKRMYNIRKHYLLSIADGNEAGLDAMDSYDRTRYIYQVADNPNQYKPTLAILSAIDI